MGVCNVKIDFPLREVVDDNGLKFLLYEPKRGIWIMSNVVEAEQVVRPSMPLWPLPKCPRKEDYQLDENKIFQLFYDVRECLLHHVVLAQDTYYDILTSFILATYAVELTPFATYLIFVGPPRTGKTAVQNIFHMLCYKPVFTSHTTYAGISHTMDQWQHPTLLIDEHEFFKGEGSEGLMAIYDAGYKHPAMVVRARKDGKGVDSYDTFGYKVLSGTTRLPPVMMSRALKLESIKYTREIPLIADEQWCLDLRTRLLGYRFYELTRYRGEDGRSNFNPGHLKSLKKLFGEAKNNPALMISPKVDVDARVVEICTPILRVLEYVKDEDFCISLLRSFSEKTKEEVKEEMSYKFLVTLLEVWKKSDFYSSIMVKDLADAMNEGVGDKEKVSTRRVGKIAGDLGLPKDKATGGGSVIVMDEKRLKELCYAHSLELPVRSRLG